MAASQNDVTLVKIGGLCRICLTENDDRFINVLDPGPDYNKCELIENVGTYFGIKINGNEQKSTILCSRCNDKINAWLDDKKKAEHNQIVVDFLAKRTSSNLMKSFDENLNEKDHSVELQTSDSSEYDKISISSESNNSISTTNSTSLCPFCNDYIKTSKIDQKNFCSRHSSPFTCLVPNCDSVFPRKEYLVPHYRLHLNLSTKTFLCSECLGILKCPRSQSNKKHKHQDLVKLFSCCDQFFQTMTDFVCHKLQEHNGKIITKKSVPEKKSDDQNLVTEASSQNLKRSRRTRVQSYKALNLVKKVKTDEVADSSKVPEVSNAYGGAFECKLCPTWFSAINLFVDHCQSKHNQVYQLKGNEIKLCPMCDENYDITNYVDHVDKCTSSMKVGVDSSNQYGCIFCQKVLNDMTASQFRNHFNYCKSFEVDGFESGSEKPRKCKNCSFVSMNLENCIGHANSHCLYFKLKMKYTLESNEKDKVLDRMELQKQTTQDIVMLFIKPENIPDNEPHGKINSHYCDWSRQKFLESFNYFCNICKKRFFSCNVFHNHLTLKGVKCRSSTLVYCTRCVSDFDSVDAFNDHLPISPPPPSLPIKAEPCDSSTLNWHKPFTFLSKSMKVEPKDFELNEATHFYDEENSVLETTTINDTNDLQLGDGNEETKIFEIDDNTSFQVPEVSNSDTSGTLLNESKDLFFNDQFQEIEISNDADILSTDEVDEDKSCVEVSTSTPVRSLNSFV